MATFTSFSDAFIQVPIQSPIAPPITLDFQLANIAFHIPHLANLLTHFQSCSSIRLSSSGLDLRT